jgi:hypothetical protein
VIMHVSAACRHSIENEAERENIFDHDQSGPHLSV